MSEMKIGRSIVYRLDTGEIIFNSGEMVGNILDILINERFADYDATKHGVINLEFGELNDEFDESNSVEVDTKSNKLVFNKKTTYKVDKTEIIGDGKDGATVTIFSESPNIHIDMNGVEEVYGVVDGKVSFTYTSTNIGLNELMVKTEKNGWIYFTIRVTIKK
jgi:hypothetical protein